jgi:hypothetical protein
MSGVGSELAGSSPLDCFVVFDLLVREEPDDEEEEDEEEDREEEDEDNGNSDGYSE